MKHLLRYASLFVVGIISFNQFAYSFPPPREENKTENPSTELGESSSGQGLSESDSLANVPPTTLVRSFNLAQLHYAFMKLQEDPSLQGYVIQIIRDYSDLDSAPVELGRVLLERKNGNGTEYVVTHYKTVTSPDGTQTLEKTHSEAAPEGLESLQ